LRRRGGAELTVRPGNIAFVSVTIPGGLPELAARLAAGGSAPAEVTHDSLYEITVTVVIAVLVVLYFDERVRGAMTPRQRGSAIGWLGGILTAGIFVPVMVLAGFVPDTRGARFGTVATVALFLLGAFGVAISAWGREDARRLRAAPTPAPMPQAPPLPDPSPHLSERERAAVVLGYAFTAVAACATTFTVLTQEEPAIPAVRAQAGEFMRSWVDRWSGLEPALAAIVTGYPSPQVREHARTFTAAAAKVTLLTAKLAVSPDPPDEAELKRLEAEAPGEFEAVAAEQAAIIAALHPEDGNGAHSPARTRRVRSAVSRDGRA
jgi:hypothetical protein